ncbi:hypothetical protein [Stenotrophobium rhamnosiphilum]|uniref:Uncharacterized protein n=1 Tax=Stenotrophobium rhamnosiphilum TaxID=2029166 RepID=A0A2T5MBG8_9GAMM|nr:hypothetical protein [Stenotrophobium rhamnosiphilum]PTU29066.1 hypothetical protein CJD38_17045 [Stenotrophobium rhamnosiphilum]
MSAVTEYLRRAVAPRLVVGLSRKRGLQQLRAAFRRALGLRTNIELFFAFDDPYAAIALPGLIEIAAAHNAKLNLLPLIARGIDGDPAATQRSVHAITDSRRLAQRNGRTLARNTPLAAEDCAFLAAWTIAAAQHPNLNSFVADALAQLWFGSDALPSADTYAAIYQQHIGALPPAVTAEHRASLASNTALLKKLGHWESPAARVAGEWYFAHERLVQIDAHLRALGA